MLRCLARSPSRAFPVSRLSLSRPLSVSPALSEKPLPPRIKFDEADLTVAYIRGGGAGGQKINKTSSSVQISHKPTGIVVKSQATRSASQNRKIAERILADKVEALQRGDQSRVAIKAERAKKKKASKVKKSRRKYRRLEEERGENKGDAGEEEAVSEQPKLQTQDQKSEIPPTG